MEGGPSSNKNREQEIELQGVKGDLERLNATFSNSRVFLGFVVILTCVLVMVFWPQPREQTERAARPLTPTSAPKQVEHVERKQVDRDSAEGSAIEPTQSGAISIKSGDFRRYLGLFVEFNAQIVEVRYARNGNAYLDIGGRHPNATLTLVVFKNQLSRFGDLREFAGHTVRINGRVTQYQEALQVILQSKNQIRLE